MNKYELLFILDNDMAEEKKTKFIDKVQSIVEKNEGNVVNIDKWGTKKFAYEINHKREGFYFLMNIEADANVPNEIQKRVNITEGAIRLMVVKKDEFKLPKAKKAEKVEKEVVVESKEDLDYGAPVKDGVDPEFGIVNNKETSADSAMENNE